VSFVRVPLAADQVGDLVSFSFCARLAASRDSYSAVPCAVGETGAKIKIGLAFLVGRVDGIDPVAYISVKVDHDRKGVAIRECGLCRVGSFGESPSSWL
jgi:hypothetical protein